MIDLDAFVESDWRVGMVMLAQALNALEKKIDDLEFELTRQPGETR